MMGALSAFSMSKHFLSSTKSVPDYTIAILPCVTRENKKSKACKVFPFWKSSSRFSGNMFNGLWAAYFFSSHCRHSNSGSSKFEPNPNSENLWCSLAREQNSFSCPAK